MMRFYRGQRDAHQSGGNTTPREEKRGCIMELFGVESLK